MLVNNPDDENDWDEYDVEVSLIVSDGKFSNITVTPKNGMIQLLMILILTRLIISQKESTHY